MIEFLDYADLYQHKNIKIYSAISKLKVNLSLPYLRGFIHKKTNLFLNQS